jgi:hypothetical protein
MDTNTQRTDDSSYVVLVPLNLVFDHPGVLRHKDVGRDLNTVKWLAWGRDSSVGIAIGYGLDGPGIESRCRRDFSHTSRPALGPTHPRVQWVPRLSRGKAAEAWC